MIPPDTMGAAGPLHLVSTLNSAVGVFNKQNGALLMSPTLLEFWSPLIDNNSLPSDVFDCQPA